MRRFHKEIKQAGDAQDKIGAWCFLLASLETASYFPRTIACHKPLHLPRSP